MNCDRFKSDDLAYHSSEQYLLLCLKICNLIMTKQCHIEQLVDLSKAKNISTNHTTPLTTTTTTTDHHLNFYYYNYYYPAVNLKATSIIFSNLNETECAKYGHRESYKMTLFIFGIILCLLILILNSLTLITIIKTRRLHTLTNILIANLSVSDFLSGISFLYPCTLNLLTINALETYNPKLYELACSIRQYYYLCLVGYSPMITSMLSSVLTLTLIAIEKYIAILKPYSYEKMVSKSRTLLPLCLGITWALSIVISLLPILGWNDHGKYSQYRGFSCTHRQSVPCMFEKIFTLDYILLFTSICGFCALTMLFIYIRIYLIARKHSKQIAQITSHLIQSAKKAKEIEQAPNVHFSTEFDIELDVPNNKLPKLRNATYVDLYGLAESEKASTTKEEYSPATITLSKTFNRSMKAMKTLLILLVGFYVCWLPLIVYFITFATHKYNNLTIYILMFVACCNAVIDPIIYSFRNRDFCKALFLNFTRRKPSFS